MRWGANSQGFLRLAIQMLSDVDPSYHDDYTKDEDYNDEEVECLECCERKPNSFWIFLVSWKTRIKNGW